MNKILNLFSLFAIVVLFGCKPDVPTPDEKLPDMVTNIQIKQSGTSIGQISFELKEQQASGTSSGNGAYQAATDIFSMLVSSNITQGPTLNIFAYTGGVKNGTYNLVLSSGGAKENIANLTMNSGTKTYQSTSGTFKITKADLYQDIGVGAADYFIDAEVNITMQNAMDNADIITVEGTLKGVNIKAQ